VLARRVERRFRERLSGGGRRRRRPTLGGGGNGAWSDGGDAAAADWAALPDAEGFDGGGLGLGGAGQPAGERDPAPSAMLPAGVAAGAAGGGDQGRNVEITPVEVRASRSCLGLV